MKQKWLMTVTRIFQKESWCHDVNEKGESLLLEQWEFSHWVKNDIRKTAVTFTK